MAESRKYIIPLRREFLKVPRYKRTTKAVKAVRNFVQKHMKVEEVKIGKYLNDLLWARGAKNPPHKVEVNVEKLEEKDKGLYAKVELTSAPKEEKVSGKKKKIAEKLKEKLLRAEKKEEPEEKKEEAPKEEVVEEKKALQKEQKVEKKQEKAPKQDINKPKIRKAGSAQKSMKSAVVTRSKKKSASMKK